MIGGGGGYLKNILGFLNHIKNNQYLHFQEVKKIKLKYA